MTNLTPIVDLRYRNYAELLLLHHDHLVAGAEVDPAETEKLEDRMSSVWAHLDEAQQWSLKGMSSDLNWVRRRGEHPPRGRKAEEVTEEEVRLLQEAEARGDWHAVLHYLRVCAPALPLVDLARRRAEAYAGVGLAPYQLACSSLIPPSADHRIFAEDRILVRDIAYVPTHRDLDPADSFRWSPQVSAEEEILALSVARDRGIVEAGTVYGLLAGEGGEIRDLGVWHQQFAAFTQGADMNWRGHPVWSLHTPSQGGVPTKEVLWKMERAGLITASQRKRLARGCFA